MVFVRVLGVFDGTTAFCLACSSVFFLVAEIQKSGNGEMIKALLVITHVDQILIKKEPLRYKARQKPFSTEQRKIECNGNGRQLFLSSCTSCPATFLSCTSCPASFLSCTSYALLHFSSCTSCPATLCPARLFLSAAHHALGPTSVH